MSPRTRRRTVTFLVSNAYGVGGVARVVANVSGALADHHDVEVLSVLRSRAEPTFAFDERVALQTLFDATRHRERWRAAHPDHRRVRLAAQPARTPMVEFDPELNALAERRLRRHLSGIRTDVIVSTRPSLHKLALDMRPADVPVAGWEHLNFATRYDKTWMAALLDDVVPRVDAWVTLTEEDREDYLGRYGRRSPPVRRIRNSSGMVGPARRPARSSKVVVGAGRLTERKGFDRAIEAWRPLAHRHPEWRLHIYGQGPDREELEEQIEAAGLRGTIRLMGYAEDMRTILADAELFLLSSRAEGFGMVLVEAMSQGTPAVAVDCPRGPSEIVTTGRNGELVPDDDIPALTAALDRMMADADLRQRLGEQALADSRHYEMDHVVAEWDDLIGAVTGGAVRRTVRRATTRLREVRRGGGRG